MPITPEYVRYIKLGDGGRWARDSIENNRIGFGYHTIPHDICMDGNWEAVWNLLSERKSDGARTAGTNEVKTFYEMGENCLWITFADGHLYWCFAQTAVEPTNDTSGDGPSRTRTTIDGWKRTDLSGRPLRVGHLSSRLTKVSNYRATICTVAEEAYLLRRINGTEEPIITRANKARDVMIDVAVEMIRMLHWSDFETLTDLIFSRSGWQRSTKVGSTLADIDIALEQPTTQETAFVQVKSVANQDILYKYLDRFRNSDFDRFFFVCHSPQGKLTLPPENNLHLFEGQRLADAAVKNGLFDWLVERSR